MSNEFQSYIHKAKVEWNAQLFNAERLLLWEEGDVPFWNSDYEQPAPALIPFLAQGDGKKGAIIVCAGGSYQWKEPDEAFPQIKWIGVRDANAMRRKTTLLAMASVSVSQNRHSYSFFRCLGHN